MLHAYSDQQLLIETTRLVTAERELLAQILHHLREIERRRLYCGQPSLFAYAVNVLKYSEDQAYRRISAMRLIKELPAIEDKIASGKLNLTHVSLAQAAFKREQKQGRPFSKEQKAELFEAISSLPKREAEKVALRFAPAPAKLIALEVSEETLQQLEQLKALLAHQLPSPTPDQLIQKALQISIEQLTPKSTTKRGGVWRRAQGKCQVCDSNFALEVDHITPKAKGGDDSDQNLRLLCRTCNQRAAIRHYGADKMSRYLKQRHRRYSA